MRGHTNHHSLDPCSPDVTKTPFLTSSAAGERLGGWRRASKCKKGVAVLRVFFFFCFANLVLLSRALEHIL